jgi:PAS domain S-box-containing protein
MRLGLSVFVSRFQEAMGDAPNLANDPKRSPQSDPNPTPEARIDQFEKRQRELWRLTFFVLLTISSVFAWLSWDSLRSEKFHLEALPIGLVVLVCLLGAYVWKKTQDIAELKGLARGRDQKDAELPSDNQLEHLFQMISKSQQGFRDLIDSFDDILLSLSLDGEIRAVNRSFAELIGLPFQEIIGKPLSHFVEDVSHTSPETIAREMTHFLDRRQWNGVVQLRFKNRNTVQYFDCAAHAMIRNGEVHGLTVLARDITSARRNEARFTELFETLQEGIYIVTPDDKILEVNPALVRMLGYASREELLGKRVSDIFIDQSQRNSVTREVNHQPVPESIEITLRRKDGQSITCLNTASAVRDSGGRVVRYQGALADITERRSIEKRLYRQQEFARRLVDSFPDLIFVVDAQRNYTFVSPKVTEVIGFDASEITGLPFGDRVIPEERASLLGIFEDLLAGRQRFGSVEIGVRHKKGGLRRLRCHFSPLFDEAGKIEGVVISARDVTEVKRLEEQLIQAEKLAAMGQMLAGVAHELNNPLTAILGVSELLRDRPGVDENAKRQLDMAHRQARRAARIVQNLLEFSRPASPQKKPLDLNTIVDRTLQLHDHSLRRNNVEVDFRPLPGLPPIIGDANQLIQVFLNLITNAEQAIHEVRPAGRIKIRIAQSSGRILVTVQDDGSGIKAEVASRLFDPFFTTKRPGGGTGLGLSICMSIIREHGGNIEGESLPAGGAAFIVTLPIPPQQGSKPLIAAESSGSGEMRSPLLSTLEGRSILVLDDEESIRMLLAEGLAAYGLKVQMAATAEQALNLVLGSKFDVILCDLKLSGSGPNSDGYNVASRLKAASTSNKPEIVFMSGDVGGDESTHKSFANAPRLQKPFRISDVLAILTEIFTRFPVSSKR